MILPIEQMGCDVLNLGLGLAALFEGVERSIIPDDDVPDFIVDLHPPAPTERVAGGGRLEVAVRAVDLLRSGQAAEYPALHLVGDGPQALAERYPSMQDIVFTDLVVAPRAGRLMGRLLPRLDQLEETALHTSLDENDLSLEHYTYGQGEFMTVLGLMNYCTAAARKSPENSQEEIG